MRKYLISFVMYLTLIIILVGCTAKPTSVVVTSAPTQAVEPTDVVVPEATQTVLTTALSTDTPVETVVPSQVSTEKPQLGANVNLNCRKFPMNIARILGHAVKGEVYDVLGMDVSEKWYLIPNPQKNTESVCWVLASETTVLTESALIPVISATTK